MQKQLYFVTNINDAEAAVIAFKSLGVSEENLSVIAQDSNSRALLPDAYKSETSDVVPALKRGITIGGTAGLVAGLSAMAFPPAGFVVGGAAVALATLGGASFGAFASSLIGVSVPNSLLNKYQAAIEAGEIMLIADVPDDQDSEIRQDVQRRIAGLRFIGTLESISPVTNV